MPSRRHPANTDKRSTVIYPSALFALEKDEVYPYERFAYNILDIAVEALNSKGLPENITVHFGDPPRNHSPWWINAGVRVDLRPDGSPEGFRFFLPEFLPTTIYVFCVSCVSPFVVDAAFQELRQSPELLRKQLAFFAGAVNAGVEVYPTGGFGAAVRAQYDHLGLTMEDLQASANVYDLLTKQLAFHEVAHAYIEQVMRQRPPTPAERKAFELIADLVATEWIYNKMIRNTPDTNSYRALRGIDTYAGTIFSNALLTQQLQHALLVLMAIAGAQRSAGELTLEGGPSHPPGMFRHQFQHVHLYTLILSNFGKLLSQEQVAKLDEDWHQRTEVLVKSGIISLDDLDRLLNEVEYETAEAAANLIEEMNIRELKKAASGLLQAREVVAQAMRAASNRRGPAD